MRSLLNPTITERLADRSGHPYFLWDVEMTLDAFEGALRDPDAEVRAYWIGKLMRQAKPDDVFRFVTLADIRASWRGLERYLGRSRPFWSWLLDIWDGRREAAR